MDFYVRPAGLAEYRYPSKFGRRVALILASGMRRDSKGRACICGYYEGQTFKSYWAVEKALKTVFAASMRAKSSKEINLCTAIRISFFEERRRLEALTWPEEEPEAPEAPFCEYGQWSVVEMRGCRPV